MANKSKDILIRVDEHAFNDLRQQLILRRLCGGDFSGIDTQFAMRVVRAICAGESAVAIPRQV